VRRGNEELVDEIFLSRLHADLAFAAATLRAVRRGRRALDVPGVGNRDDHVLFLDEVLHVDLGFRCDDLGTPRVLVFRPDLFELADDDVHQDLDVGQDPRKPGNVVAELAVILCELLALEPRETRKPHLENGLRLPLRQEILLPFGGLGDLGFRAAGSPDEVLETDER
jgi:hypothetical protein